MSTSGKIEIVVLGAGYAGVLAAFRLNGKARRQVHVTLINRDADFVERIRLHQAAAGYTKHRHALANMLRGSGIDFVQGNVTALHPAQHKVTVQTAHGEKQLHYDKLVYALGSTIDTRTIPGIREHAFVITQEGAAQLQQILPSAKKLLIIGGGLTGIETATEFAEAYPHLQVTLATAGNLGADLSHKAQHVLAQTFARMGITVQANVKIERINRGEAVTTTGSVIPFEVCVWAGAFAVSDLGRDSGLAVTERGLIRVDDMLRSMSHPDIYAAGDAAAFDNMRMACATAEPMAAHAADNIVAALNGKAEHPFSFGYGGRCISLGRKAGLVQLVQRDDTPIERIITGRTGALIKEIICRYAFNMLRAERYFPGLYMWMKAGAKHESRELNPTRRATL